MTFRGLVEDARLEEARRLLARPDLKVSEVGKVIGYTAPGSFTRAFERWAGVALSNCRAQLLGTRLSEVKNLLRQPESTSRKMA